MTSGTVEPWPEGDRVRTETLSDPVIALVVAVGENGVIGRNGGLPWRIPSDLKAFRRLTMGKPVIMGRRTFETLKKPLDGRENIVVTRASKLAHRGCWTVASIAEALEFGRRLAAETGAGEVMIIGGGELYQAVLPFAQRIYWTEVHASPAGDTFFPELETGAWCEVSRSERTKGETDEFAWTLKVLERRRAG